MMGRRTKSRVGNTVYFPSSAAKTDLFATDDGKRFDYLKLIFVREFVTGTVSTDSCIPDGMRFVSRCLHRPAADGRRSVYEPFD
jgi:hypothetical protein